MFLRPFLDTSHTWEKSIEIACLPLDINPASHSNSLTMYALWKHCCAIPGSAHWMFSFTSSQWVAWPESSIGWNMPFCFGFSYELWAFPVQKHCFLLLDITSLYLYFILKTEILCVWCVFFIVYGAVAQGFTHAGQVPWHWTTSQFWRLLFVFVLLFIKSQKSSDIPF